MRTHTAVAVFACLALLFSASARIGRSSAPDPMIAAANTFLASLSPELRSRCVFPFDARERLDWHFVPRSRPGITLGEMTDTQRIAARDLIRSALSAGGTLKVHTIMELDSILYDMERAAGGDGSSRDPLRYDLAVFGTPGVESPWGWKVEGHHISLNFSSLSGDVVATTPAFLGANPAQVRTGPRAGLRALAAEEDLARELLASLDEAQRATAVIATTAPRDILTAPGRPLDLGTPAGLLASEMTPAQRAILERLIDEYARTLRPDLAEIQLARMKPADLDGIRFAWAGGTSPGEGHYYRITGTKFVIEYDNIQNDANHIHTVWHDLEHDFGLDLLAEHYRAHEAGK